jgi:hypothetical protein
MRLLTSAMCTATAVALLAGCSGSTSSTGSMSPVGTSGANTALGVNPGYAVKSLIPEGFRPLSYGVLHGIQAPASAMKGIYVSEVSTTSIVGYKSNNKKNKAPRCTVPFADSYPNDIDVDGAGNLIDPNGGTRTIIIGQGPDMCGAEAASISDPYGQPNDASSANALTGKIAIGNRISMSGPPGSISVCTVADGCTVNLTNAALYLVAGVAMANNGDCWGDAIGYSGAATLTYFAGCAGAGVQASGFTNVSFGGIDLDKFGHLVTIDILSGYGDAAVDVYSGCNPVCTLIGGPFPLEGGGAVFGHLNKDSRRFATGDYINGQVDIYKYHSSKTGAGTSLTYEYSFNKGLDASKEVEGVAYNPRSKQ